MLTASLSGFGGSYEWGCQRMLQLGLAWLKTHPTFSFEQAYKQYENVYGICSAENEGAKALDAAIMDDSKLTEGGVTGAMHQCVIGHLAFIHAHGYDKWITELKAAREPAELFEFDGSVECCGADRAFQINGRLDSARRVGTRELRFYRGGDV